MDRVQSAGYYDSILQVLRNNNADLKFLSHTGPLVLRGHENGFSGEEQLSIQDYVLQFVPTQVKIRDMVASLFYLLFQAFKEMATLTVMHLIQMAIEN